MQDNWPNQLAVGVVEVLSEAPLLQPNEQGAVYDTQEVRAVNNWFLLRWITKDPQAPGDHFRIHYWFRPQDGEGALKVGERRIAFLAPAKAQGIFVTDMLLLATEENVAKVRQQIRRTFLDPKW